MVARIRVLIVIVFAALVWGILLASEDVPVSLVWLRHVSTVTAAVLLLLAVFDQWLWRHPFFQGWLVRRPVLDGTWRASLVTVAESESDLGDTIVVGFMVVRQTHSSISARLLTSESQSRLLSGRITRSADGLYTFSATYMNEPGLELRERSPIHYGAFALRVIGRPASRLEGSYWTDRGTRGTIELTDRRRKEFESFREARDSYARR